MSVTLKNGLDVPETVAYRMVVEAEEDHRRRAHWLEGELRTQVDDRLRVRYFESNHGVPWITPGRWHVLRLNDGGAPPSAMPIEADGKYCEPHSGVIEELLKRDSWKLKGTLHDHVQAHTEQRIKARKKEADEAREAAKEDFVTATKVALNPRPRFGKTAPQSGRGDGPRR